MSDYNTQFLLQQLKRGPPEARRRLQYALNVATLLRLREFASRVAQTLTEDLSSPGLLEIPTPYPPHIRLVSIQRQLYRSPGLGCLRISLDVKITLHSYWTYSSYFSFDIPDTPAPDDLTRFRRKITYKLFRTALEAFNKSHKL